MEKWFCVQRSVAKQRVILMHEMAKSRHRFTKYSPGQPNWDFWPEIIQCGNLAIDLLWFYVKSIVADFRRLTTLILTILEALNFDFFGKISHWNVSTIPKNSKFRAAQIVQMTVFDFTQNLSWEKILKFPQCVNIPN